MSSLTKIFKSSQNAISTWIIAFFALCLNFAPLIFEFIWGNHDWMPLVANNKITSGLIEGRFSQYLFLKILFDGNILPVLNIILGFLIYSLSITQLATKVFKFNLKNLSSTLIVLSVVTLPYIIEILYFQFICFSMLTWPLVITFSAIFAKKALEEHKIINTIISCALLLFAIGGYPASINMYVTIFCLLFVQQKNTTLTELKLNFIKFLPFVISIIVSLIILKLCYIYLQNQNLMLKLYNNNTITLQEIPYQIPQTLFNSILSLIQPQPFFSLLLKVTILITFIFFSIDYILKAKTYKAKAIHFLIICTLLICIKFSAFLTKETSENYFAQFDPVSFMLRTDFYSIPTLILFALLYINNKKKYIYKNIVFVISIVILWINITSNYNFCKVSILGFKAENMLTDRIITRIQNHPNFVTIKPYSLLQIGEYSLRPKYYQPQALEKYGYYTLKTPFTRFWSAKEFYNFYIPNNFVANSDNLSIHNLNHSFNDFITNKINTWPNKNSIYINNNHILVILTEDAKQSFKRQFNSITR